MPTCSFTCFAHAIVIVNGWVQVPNVLTWVNTIINLDPKKAVEDASTIVNLYNKKVAKTHRLDGPKAISVKLMIQEMPQQALDVVNRCAKQYGWKDSPYTDCTMSSRKTMPNYQFRGGTKNWQAGNKGGRNACKNSD